MILGSRYKVSHEIPQRGGMSKVYVGIDQHLDRPIILKSLQPFQKPQRIFDEQKALQEVVSKHVVQLLDTVQETVAGVAQTYLVSVCQKTPRQSPISQRFIIFTDRAQHILELFPPC